MAYSGLLSLSPSLICFCPMRNKEPCHSFWVCSFSLGAWQKIAQAENGTPLTYQKTHMLDRQCQKVLDRDVQVWSRMWPDITRTRGKSSTRSHQKCWPHRLGTKQQQSWFMVVVWRFANNVQEVRNISADPCGFLPKSVFSWHHIALQNINTVGQNSRELSSQFVN